MRHRIYVGRYMLSITYAQCLNDPSYCDDGKEGGAILVKQLGIRANSVVPLEVVFPHIKLREALWCLRVVKPSQRIEANRVAWGFIKACVCMFPLLCTTDVLDYIDARAGGCVYRSKEKHELHQRYDKSQYPLHKLIRMVIADGLPSQIAVNVLEETLKQAIIQHDDHGAEATLREVFRRLL